MSPPRVLFVSNGHGESSIAERIAREVRALDSAASVAHLPLVGMGTDGAILCEVGPRRLMPSGGLVAMGNVRAFASDVRAGFAMLFARQLRFLRDAHTSFDVAVAVGDVYALGLTLVSRLPTVFVGTAKSAYVAPYGPFERTLLRRARSAYVRDERTAALLHERGVAALPANVIADLHEPGPRVPAGAWIGLLPGSRPPAYRDALWLAAVARALGTSERPSQALLSVAPTLEAARFAEALAGAGWAVQSGAGEAPFAATRETARIVGWSGPLGSLFAASFLVIGQAGTANEAAAGAGVPVVAPEGESRFGSDWYRMRQRRLLGDALAVVPGEPDAAAAAIRALLADSPRMERMRSAGLARVGGAGAARRVAAGVLELAAAEGVAS